VNVSGAQFTVANGSIHFGLAAIKNVGGTAIESIVKNRRESGTFPTLEDFCSRADLRLVNRRVLESLIKAGAFDSLEVTRAGLLSGLDQAMEIGQRRQRDRDEGQTSLFDALGPGPTPAPAARSMTAGVPEWPHEEMLAYEKEVLGFYLSGHPLEQYRDVARRLNAVTSAELAARPVGARVLLLGLVSALTENATKSGNRMAFATLELVDGSVPVTVFPEPYRTCANALKHRGPVLVRGRTDDSDKGRVVLAEDVKPLEDVGTTNGRDNGGGPLTCRIRLRANGDAVDGRLASLRSVCEEHSGRTPLFVHVVLADQEVVVRVKELLVEPDASMVAKVETLLGPGSILVEYAGRA
jgi:DNA polymerase-3 subunit alpha